LPVPEGPTMDSVSPVSTVRLTPLRTGTSKALWTSMYSITSVQEERREHRVQDEDGDDHEDDGGSGGAADPLGPAPGANPMWTEMSGMMKPKTNPLLIE